MSDVAERVKKIVIEHLSVDADKVVEGANFIDDLVPTASTRSSS